MNLDYNILWVDDNIEGLESLFDSHINGQIDSLGFVMQLYKVSNEEELNTIINAKKNFNLIFMDYYFDDENKGIQFIEEIRAKDIYCNIIFYSAQGVDELKKAITENNLNGTYVYYRPNILRDIDKIKRMIRFDIMSNLDESTMRGITMAQVAEIDHLLLEIVKNIPDDSKWKTIEKNAKLARHRHCKKLIDKHDNDEKKSELLSKCQEVLSISDSDLKTAILNDPEKSSRVFPTAARTEFLYGNNIFNQLLENYDKNSLLLFKKYKIDVIELRNKLAHYKNPGEIDYIELRKNIILHKNNIIKIADYFRKISENSVSNI